MWRLLFIFSVVGIVISLTLRWWFGLRVLETQGRRPCKCDLNTWMPAPGDNALIHHSDEDAEEFGRQLRLKALAEWKERNPKAYASRESARQFGIVAPTLSGIIVTLAVIVAKIPIFGMLAVFASAISLSSVCGILAIAPELQAILASSSKVRKDRSFHRRDDEDAVIDCAIAHVWKNALPPLLQKLQK
jgi:hypothetical protein